jgi:hypothetical protein
MIQLLRGKEPNAHIKFSITTIEILQAAVAANKLASRSLGIGTLLLQARSELLDKIRQANREIPS